MRPIPNKRAKVWQSLTKMGVTLTFTLKAMKEDVSEEELKSTPPQFKRYSIWRLGALMKEKIPSDLLTEFYPKGLSEITVRKAVEKLEKLRLVYVEKVIGHHGTQISINNKYYDLIFKWVDFLDMLWTTFNLKEGEREGGKR